jgi:multisubunit Na+/H+ antiporter MnhC subunit
MLDMNIMMASMLWGTVGGGFCLYGRKTGATVPVIGGVILVALSFLPASPLIMSLVATAIIGGMAWFMKQGY